jgi:glycosyltransferase involved in cell wall biosynthesis
VLIDAHYFYPDGVAAALLAKWFRLPVVITARGSDLNLIARHALPRAMMVWAARHAAAAVAVSEALADALRRWGLAPGSVRVMRNGVDGQRFQSLPASQARQALGLRDGPMLLSVGNLVPLKQHQVPIAVLAALAPSFPGLMLTIIGEGPLKDDLRRQAVALGVGERVHFTGAIAQEQLPLWYSAADLLILASTREGLPNVVLEAMACGTPVVASRVGGVPEVVDTEVCGSLVDADDVQAFVAATLTRLRQPADRQAVRAHALTMSWDRTSQAQLALFRDIQARPHGTRGA